MKSVTRTVPAEVCQSVSRISESVWYRRVTWACAPPGAGVIRQCPCCSVPSSAAKQAGESNRGRHSQSTEPSRLTSAADCMSPMSA
jgi:hypothetical protein